MVYFVFFVFLCPLGFSKSTSHVYIECMTDRRDIERLFKQHYRQMYRLAAMLLHDDAESKDVVHDVFAQLLIDSRSLKERLREGATAGKDTTQAFLFTCVRNRCLNVMRNRKIQERIQRLYLLDLETTILSESQLREEAERLSEGIRQLQPPVCHDIILWHFRDGLTFSEIARRLQVSETTVYKHLRRALESLRVQLKTQESV